MRKYINLSSFSHAKVRRHSMMFIDSLVHPGQELSHLLGLLGQLLNVPQVLAMISWVKENGLLLDESQSFVCVTLECVHCTGHGESCLVSLFVLVKALLQNGGLEMWWVFFLQNSVTWISCWRAVYLALISSSLASTAGASLPASVQRPAAIWTKTMTK